jgi:hypothetical protein
MKLQQIHQESAVTIALKKCQRDLQGLVDAGGTTAHDIAALIDEIGGMLPIAETKQQMIKALQKDLLPYTEKMRTLTTLLSEIEGRDPDETFQCDGTVFTAMVGKRYVVRTVVNSKLAIKLLNRCGKGVGWNVITVPLGKLDTYLDPEEKAHVIKVDRGERSVAIIKKAT